MKSRPEMVVRSGEPIVFHSLAQMPPLPVSLAPTLYNKTGTWRYIRPVHVDRTPPCNHACPAGNDIVHWLAALRAGDVERAWRILVAENPLPGVCGRVCPHPCEAECNRADLGGAIAIQAVERYLADEAAAHGWRLERPLGGHERRVAIVGAGPAGLSCAYHLARLGHLPTVYEAHDRPGGLLSHAIPAYRLPPAVLEREIEAIKALGVRFELRARLGDNLSFEQLLEADAVFLAPGQALSHRLGVPGEEATGVVGGLDYLRAVAAGQPPDLGPQVIVVGGGNTAVDAARCALRRGATVTVLYRRGEAQMPANPAEVEEARAEGVEFRFLAAPLAVIARAGRVAGLRCQAMRLGEPDSSGRERPVPIPGTEFDLPGSAVIAATGQELDARLLTGVALHAEKGLIPTDAAGGTALSRVFAGGDAATGAGTVAQAIGSGKRAALAIDWQLRTGNLEGFAPGSPARATARGTMGAVVRPADLNPDYIESVPRPALAQRQAGLRRGDLAEVNLGLPAGAAHAEAARCISCGTCTSCDTCLIFCPDVAIARAEGGRYAVAYDYCKGCGICAEECPRAAVSMQEEGQ